MRSCVREKRIYCGEKYLEVDIYPAMKSKRKKGARAKKKEQTLPKQENQNQKVAKRTFSQIVKTNFNEEDYHVTLTYNKANLPKDMETAEKEAKNYIRRIAYKLSKEEMDKLKYVIVTEYESNEEKPVQVHHHIIMKCDLPRNVIEDTWSKRRKGKKKPAAIGYVNADRIQTMDNGLERLSQYLLKKPKGKRKWRASKNLQKPESINNDHKYSRRKVETLAKLSDESEWEKLYPGWKIIKNGYGMESKFNDHMGWCVYLKFERIEGYETNHKRGG